MENGLLLNDSAFYIQTQICTRRRRRVASFLPFALRSNYHKTVNPFIFRRANAHIYTNTHTQPFGWQYYLFISCQMFSFHCKDLSLPVCSGVGWCGGVYDHPPNIILKNFRMERMCVGLCVRADTAVPLSPTIALRVQRLRRDI